MTIFRVISAKSYCRIVIIIPIDKYQTWGSKSFNEKLLH